MEQHPFSLTSALESWKRRLRHGRAVTDDDLAELESHLHDSMAELRRSGLSEEESFMIASHRLGDVRTLAAELSENKPPPIPVPTGSPRVEPSVTASELLDPPKSGCGCWSGSLKLIGLLLILGGVASMLFFNQLEKKYVGRVKLQVHHQGSTSAGLVSSGNWIETEFKIITAAETLRLVVQEKALTKRWALGTDENAAVQRLATMVEATEERGTNLICLEVYSPGPDEAAELANAVADAYQRRRKEFEVERAAESIAAVQKKLAAQERIVEEKRAAMLALMKQHGIVDLPGPTDASSTSASLEQEITERASVLQQLMNLEGDALLERISQDERIGVTLKEFIPQAHRIRLMIAEYEQQGLGSKHPKLMGLRAQEGKLKKILAEAGEGFRQKLQTEIEVLTQTLASRKKGIAAPADQAAQSEYATAKREYEQQLTRLSEQRVETYLATPWAPVQIHEKAYPDNNVVRPNLRTFFLGGIASILLGILLFGLAFAVDRRSAN